MLDFLSSDTMICSRVSKDSRTKPGDEYLSNTPYHTGLGIDTPANAGDDLFSASTLYYQRGLQWSDAKEFALHKQQIVKGT